MRAGWLVACVGLVQCGSPPLPEDAPSRADAAPVALAPADSLAFRTAGGTEVWFVGGRVARDSAGRECLERSLEIRDHAGRRGVPLLYTLEPPAALDDSSIQARISNRCTPGDRYRIALRTGRPTPLRAR